MQLILLLLPLIVVNCFPLDISNLPQSSGQRQIVISQWSGSGIGNVRRETIAANVIGTDGKPIASTINARKQNDGTTVSDCHDVFGTMRSHGEEYSRSTNHFLYKCNNGIEEIVACIATERANNARIDVGNSLTVNGFWHRCDYFPENFTAIYTQESGCTVNGKEYHIGETLRGGFFRMACQADGYKITGCYYADENKNYHEMEPDTKVEAGQYVHTCERKTNGEIGYFSKTHGCSKNNQIYKEGEQFSANHLKYICTNGRIDITGCYVNETHPLSIGANLIDRHMVYQCFRSNGAVHYQEYGCGYASTPSCTPDAIPQQPQPTNIDLKSSNGGAEQYHAFSVIAGQQWSSRANGTALRPQMVEVGNNPIGDTSSNSAVIIRQIPIVEEITN